MSSVEERTQLQASMAALEAQRAILGHDVVATLEPGDVVWWLDTPRNPAEPALTTFDGAPVWVWHVGLYLSLIHI